MTPRENGSTDCLVALSDEKSREFVDFLLEDGDQTALQDAVAIDTDTDDIDDVTGWGTSVSFPRPPLSEARRDLPVGNKKKNSTKHNQPEMDLTRMIVRCVNEDFAGDHQKAVWKANVEPGTYRYISNNGIYRSTKFANAGTDWVTAKRARHIDHNTTSLEVKHAQKTLRKDLDHHFKNIEITRNERDGPSPSYQDKTNAKINQPHGIQQEWTSKKFTFTNTSSGPGDSESLPPPSRPPKDPKLVKSASDLFVENFSTRISALEKTDKETISSTSAPRTPCMSPFKPGSSSLPQPAPNKRPYDGGNQATADAARSVLHYDDISKDVFTVRPVTRAPDQPLGPLEKLTPQQKLLANESECSSILSKSQPESPSLTTSFMTAMNAFAQLHTNAHRPRKKNSKSNPTTYRQPYKSNSMSNVSDTDSLNSVRNALTLTNSNIERMRMGNIATEVKHPVKDYGRFLATKSRPGQPPCTTTTAFGRSIRSKSLGRGSDNSYKQSVVGYKTLSTSAPISYGPSIRQTQLAPTSMHPVITSTTVKVDEASNCALSDTSESYLSGTSLTVNRGSGRLRDEKGKMALPEISGKRLAVNATTQRML